MSKQLDTPPEIALYVFHYIGLMLLYAKFNLVSVGYTLLVYTLFHLYTFII